MSAPAALTELPPRPDANGTLVPMRLVAVRDANMLRFGYGGVQMTQIGTVAAPTNAEAAYVAALEHFAAFMDTERRYWKTECPPRLMASKQLMNAQWLLKHAREAETREERCHHAWFYTRVSPHTTFDLTARRNDAGGPGPYLAQRAVGETRRANIQHPQSRHRRLAELLDALVAAREAAYPRAWADAIEPLFTGR